MTRRNVETPKRRNDGGKQVAAGAWGVLSWACAAAMSLLVCAGASADASDFLLVRRSLQVQNIRLVEINEQSLTHFEQGRPESRIPLSDCIALINPLPAASISRAGMLILADGQQIPGEPFRAPAEANNDRSADSFAWSHPWLGRLDVPLKNIHAVLLDSSRVDPAASKADVVILVNGDRLEGIVTALGADVVIEPVDAASGAAASTIPLDRVASIVLVTPRKTSANRRIWFGDGTVLDVQSIALGDDMYVRLSPPDGAGGLISGTQVPRVGLSDISAVLLDSKAMLPLASIVPLRIEGPSTRYVVPKPELLDADAPVGLSPIEFRGPVVVRYSLPAGASKFAAEAVLPASARTWGDVELIVRSDDAEVFRSHLNADSPSCEINVALTGRELTVELTVGAHGPIQDQVVFNRAMILKKR